jgi:hypothetical protein
VLLGEKIAPSGGIAGVLLAIALALALVPVRSKPGAAPANPRLLDGAQ